MEARAKGTQLYDDTPCIESVVQVKRDRVGRTLRDAAVLLIYEIRGVVRGK